MALPALSPVSTLETKRGQARKWEEKVKTEKRGDKERDREGKEGKGQDRKGSMIEEERAAE